MGCLICERIEQIQKGCNPYFVCELETGYVVLGDHQRFTGYTLFLCKQHETELHLLPWDYRMKFLQEMSLVAEAVYQVYQPEKMNYELLGNGDTIFTGICSPCNWGYPAKRTGLVAAKGRNVE